MNEEHSITQDPIYYVTAALFAILTTVLPAMLGQRLLLPLLQTLLLTAFVVFTLHNRNVRGALTVMAIWLPLQYVLVALLTTLFTNHLENAFSEAFTYRGALTAWYVSAAPYPAGLSERPLSYLIEAAWIVIGSLATAGIAGIWNLIGIVNRAGFASGALASIVTNPAHIFYVIPYWTLLRVAGYAGLTVLAALPLMTYNWSPSYYWQSHRKLILVSVALVAAALVVEFFLPGLIGTLQIT